MRDRCPTEIKRPARRVADHLHAGRVEKGCFVRNRRSERCHFGLGVIFQSLDQPVDHRRVDLRFVALHVHKNIEVLKFFAACKCGHAVGAARQLGIGSLDPTPEAMYLADNLLVAGRYPNSQRSRRGCGRPIGMLEHTPAGFLQQQLLRQAGRGGAGRDDHRARRRGDVRISQLGDSFPDFSAQSVSSTHRICWEPCHLFAQIQGPMYDYVVDRPQAGKIDPNRSGGRATCFPSQGCKNKRAPQPGGVLQHR